MLFYSWCNIIKFLHLRNLSSKIYEAESPFPMFNICCYFSDPYLINWYATNADYSHSKLTNIPIGMALDYLPYGNLTTMRRAVKNYK